MRHAPIIALTANATKTDIDKCLSSGMNDYLPKPFTPNDLYRKIFRDLRVRTQKNGTADKDASNGKAGFDLAYLRSVSDDNHEFLQEMIQTFVQTMPPLLTEMDHALAEKNWKKLSRLAHQIKPSFGLLGMDALKKTVFYIEENAEQKINLEDVSRTTAEFIKDCSVVIKALKKEITA
jgi:HPt (histidine-containing phosphotransfer) domain-containing protein